MARVTIEDCLTQESNHFELVMKAAKRARDLSTGASEASISWKNDKPTVVALKELAMGKLAEEDKQNY